MRGLLIIMALVTALLPRQALGRLVPPSPTIETPDLVSRPADVVIDLTNETWFGAFLSRDGRTVYVIAYDENTANIWGMLVYLWPLWATMLLGVIQIFVIRAFVRRLRRSEAAGEPYCRKCHYCLTECTSQTCPECGVSLTRHPPRNARSMRPLSFGMLTWTLVAGSTIAAIWLLDLPRTGSVANWFTWPSRALHQYLKTQHLEELEQSVGIVTVVLVEFDTSNGHEQTRHVLHLIPNPSSVELVMSAARRYMSYVIQVHRHDHLARFQLCEQTYVFDENQKRLLKKLKTPEPLEALKATDAEFGFKPGCALNESYSYKSFDGHSYEPISIENTKINRCKICGTARLTEGKTAGNHLFLQVAGERRWNALAQRDRSASEPDIIVGDIKRGLWFARLDVGDCRPFLMFEADASGRRLMVCEDQWPKKIHIFDLSSEIERLPKE